MTTPPKNKTPATTRSPFFFVGALLSALGGGIAGAFIARQFMEAGTGHTYYEFIAGGAAIAMIGIVIVWNLRRKKQ
jgi:membrane protein DedA with SNARE-associated domain